jgi:hypothetical protein
MVEISTAHDTYSSLPFIFRFATPTNEYLLHDCTSTDETLEGI